MTLPRPRIAAATTAVAFACALGGNALGANAAPPAAAEPGGYAGKGQLVLRTSFPGVGTDVTVSGDIALEERGAFLRIDLLTLAIPGTDQLISSLLSTQLIPPGGFTLVFDRAAGTYTVWSSSKRASYTSRSATATGAAAQTPPAGTAAALGAVGDLFGAFAFASSLKGDSAFNASVSLAGHGVVNGHPATGLDYQYARTTTAGETTEIRGRLQLADDLNEVPVEVTASGKSNSFPQSSLRLDLTRLEKAAVAEDDFHVPAGFLHLDDLGGVLGKTL